MLSTGAEVPPGTSAILVAALLVSGLTGASCARDGSAGSGPREAVAAPAPVTLLEPTLAPLVDRFNQDSGKARVLALLSPT